MNRRPHTGPRGEGGPCRPLALRKERACGAIVRPHGYGEWTQNCRTVGFFLEHDTGSENISILLGKIERYHELASAGITRPVLFHLPIPTREANLHRALARRHGPAGPPAQVATTSAEHDTTTGPPGPRWQPAPPPPPGGGCASST